MRRRRTRGIINWCRGLEVWERRGRDMGCKGFGGKSTVRTDWVKEGLVLEKGVLAYWLHLARPGGTWR